MSISCTNLEKYGSDKLISMNRFDNPFGNTVQLRRTNTATIPSALNTSDYGFDIYLFEIDPRIEFRL